MSGLILAACVLTAPPSAVIPSSPPSTSQAQMAVQPPQRTLNQWRTEVQQALKAQASAKEAEQPATIMKLVELYRDLAAAGPLNSGEDKRLRTLVRMRLVRLREEVPQDVQKRLARVKSAEEKAARQNQPELLDRVKDDKVVLNQWKGILAQVVGVQAAGGGGTNRDDDGPELVDLIQAVITPDFWDVNGGPGAIVYYQGQHALVVRATTEKHEEIAALLNALRRAGN